MSTQQILAILAATLGVAMAAAPLLQAARVLRCGSAGEVSVGWLAVIVWGASAWLAYGVSLGDVAIIVANAVGVLAAIVTLGVVVAVRRRPGRGVAVIGEREPA